ncbi:MAG: CsbD family protein [Acidobacteriia bacterium]|nr:CsbD family protein [Terriglobia bacterium]
MNWDQVEGKWKQLKGSVRQKWGKLTDDDLTYIAGKRDAFVGRLQERYGIAREEAQKQADEWLKAQRETEVRSGAGGSGTPS